MYCRKNFLDLTTTELTRLANALNQVYDEGIVTSNASAHDAGWFNIHRGPAFLPWHRWFLLQFENHLRRIDARVFLPYWNWTDSNARDLDSEPWKSFFGGRANSGGNFDHWSYNRASDDGGNTLPSIENVIGELNVGTYSDFRGMEFGTHVPGHTWTGGTMSSPESPADPLFYLHHCNVDRLWAIWQLNNSGADQYSLDNEAGDLQYADTFVPLNGQMFSAGIGASATPASMLDHQVLGYHYPKDGALENAWSSAGLGTIISGDPTEISLLTNEIRFNDVPEGETTMRAAHFTIKGCEALTFEVTNSPGTPFELFSVGPYNFPTGGLPTDDFRIWLTYAAFTANTVHNDTISIRALDEDDQVIDQWNDIPIIGNSVEREKVAIAMVMDESGSMLYDAGNNRTRLQVLQTAANTFVDQLFDDNGLSLISFDETGNVLTGLQVAGGMLSSVRNDARTEIATHGPADIYPHTSIGAGLEKAHEMFENTPESSDYDVRATLVFTDGFEDQAPWLDDVDTAINERVYAVGVGDAGHVSNEKLNQIADGSGGYMIVSGANVLEDEFLLEKYFIQILASVTNNEIVVDPVGNLKPGVLERIPFHLTRSDISFDAIALNRITPYVVMGLQTPDGSIYSQFQLAASQVRRGNTSNNLRITLPLVIDGKEHWEGEWQFLLALSARQTKTHTHNTVRSSVLQNFQGAFPYSAIIHSRSNLKMRTQIDKTDIYPGAKIQIQSILTEYGQPLIPIANVQAVLTKPDQTEQIIYLSTQGQGIYQKQIEADQAGIYRFYIRANGLSSKGSPFTREEVRTTYIAPAGATPPNRPTPLDCDDIRRLIKCCKKIRKKVVIN